MKIFGYEIKKIPRSQSIKFIDRELDPNVVLDIGDLSTGEIDNILFKFNAVERQFPKQFSTIDKANLLKIFCASNNYRIEIVRCAEF